MDGYDYVDVKLVNFVPYLIVFKTEETDEGGETDG